MKIKCCVIKGSYYGSEMRTDIEADTSESIKDILRCVNLRHDGFEVFIDGCFIDTQFLDKPIETIVGENPGKVYIILRAHPFPDEFTLFDADLASKTFLGLSATRTPFVLTYLVTEGKESWHFKSAENKV